MAMARRRTLGAARRFVGCDLAPAETQAALADGRTRGGETIYVRYRRLSGQDEN